MNGNLSDYWVRQAKGAERRAATWREKEKWHRDPKWCRNMARGADKEFAGCFRHWRALNPSGSSEPFHNALNAITNERKESNE